MMVKCIWSFNLYSYLLRFVVFIYSHLVHLHPYIALTVKPYVMSHDAYPNL